MSALFWLTAGALLCWYVMYAIDGVRAGVWDRPERLDITTAHARDRRLEQLAVEQRTLDVEQRVLRERRPEAN